LEGYSEDQTDYVQQKSSATLTLSPGGGAPPKKRSVTGLKNGDSHTNGNSESDNVTTIPPSLRFTQIRSAKRVEKVEEGISTETLTQIPLVIDPLTKESLTLAQAIGCGLIDIKSGQFVHPQTGERITLQEAAELGYLDARILHKLMGTCGVVDPQTGAELTLLQAIKMGYYDLSRGNYIHPQTGEPISAEQAVKLGLNMRQKVSVVCGLQKQIHLFFSRVLTIFSLFRYNVVKCSRLVSRPSACLIFKTLIMMMRII